MGVLTEDRESYCDISHFQFLKQRSQSHRSSTHGRILPFVLENLMPEATHDKTNEQAERLSN
jgi:hypothetical protein